MSRIIEVTVSPTGDVTVQTKGYSGSKCLSASKFLEDALGVISSDRKTSEFFEVEQIKQELKQ